MIISVIFFLALVTKPVYAISAVDYVKYDKRITVALNPWMTGYYIDTDEIWKGSKTIKVSSNNGKIIDTSSFYNKDSNRIEFSVKKTGTAKLSIKLKKGTHSKIVKAQITVVKYKQPFSIITIAGKKAKATVNLTSEGNIINVKAVKGRNRINISPKKGWTVSIYSEDYDAGTDKIVKTIYMNNSKLSTRKNTFYRIQLFNKKKNQTLIYGLNFK